VFAVRINAIYNGLCPNCGGPIGYERLSVGLPCGDCLPVARSSGGNVLLDLEESGRLAGLKWVLMLSREYASFSEYFRSKTGLGLWSAQASWARRLLSLDSFTIIAPTGVGKTTLLSVYAAYRAEVSGWRVLYLVPTGNLAREVYRRIKGYTGGVVAYYSAMPASAREEALKAIRDGNYRILVVTTGFLQRRFGDLMAGSPFNLILVDDVDSMLRDGRNVERVLKLLGYDDETIRVALDLVKTRIRFLKSYASGREDLSKALAERVASLESRLRELIRGVKVGQLIVASATGRPRGLKHLVFKELLNFEVGGGGDYLRNVIDTYTISTEPEREVVRLAGQLGPGGIVFVSQYIGVKAVNRIVDMLREAGLKADKAVSSSWKSIERLERGELDVIVSVASRYGVTVRGLDAPRVVRYTVFLGAPARSLGLEESLLNPRRLQRVLIHMRDEGVSEASELLTGLQRLIERVEDPMVIAMALRKGAPEEHLEVARRAYEVAVDWIRRRVLELGRLKVGSLVFTVNDGRVYTLIPDALTYIQASGRASRLLDGAMTLGLSVVVEPLEELMEALVERLKWYGRFEFKNFKDVDVDEVKRLLEVTRRGGGRKVRVRTVLLVVESPTKARTIAWFWGRPGRRRVNGVTVYETSYLDDETGDVVLLQVTATRGHLFDLVEELSNSIYGVIADGNSYKPVYDFIRRCRSCGHQFTSGHLCPRCGSGDVVSSRSVVEALRRLSLEVEDVVIATDPDVEGEKIAWDVLLALRPYNPNVRRARFNEVTRDAIVGALRNPGEFDVKAVEAQMTRRIIDRWVGYAISGYLQRVYNIRWLGAGRVQSPVLKWIVDRYREWASSRGYIVCLKLDAGGRVCINVKSMEEAERISNEGFVVVRSVDTWLETLSPQPPYTTDTLLYDASRKLGLSAEKAMRIAQELFESGLITYHRTDSTRVSSTGMAIARAYLESRGLPGEFRPRSWGEGGAHEAIRPTRPLDLEDLEKALAEGTVRVHLKLTWGHRALYDLVFRRFIASQMREAKVVKARVELEVGGLLVPIEGVVKLVEEGFTRVYTNFRLEEWIQNIEPGAVVKVVEASTRRSSLVPLYTTGDIVRMMKEKGVGRPSTYHKAIEANRRHGYVVVSRRRGYLIPTKLGIQVSEFLRTHFSELTSEEYTRVTEERLKMVEVDGVNPNMVLRDVLKEISRRTGVLEVETEN
jgi:reverse gyrase